MNTSRRAVLKAAGPIVLAGAWAPSVWASTHRRVTANDRLTLGLIGMGIQNRFHLGAFRDRPDTQIVAVCDVDTTRRTHAQKVVDDHYAKRTQSGKYAGCAAYADHRELLARTDIDAVVIATPDHWHAIQCLDAIRAGKHIYCEKPLTHTLHEAQTLIRAVRASKIVFQTGSQQRSEFDGRFARACELVRSGKIGDLITIVAGVGTTPVGPSSVPCDLIEETLEPGLDWERWLGPAPLRPYNSILSPRGINNHYPDWRNYREYSGGMITDWGAHHFDIVQWALDMDQAGPVAALPPPHDRAQFGAKLVYPSGVELVHGGSNGIHFLGSKGSIFVNRDRLEGKPEGLVKDAPGADDVKLPRIGDHRANWVECIRTGTRPICDVEVGARSVACCHLMNLAYWHRRPLKWDPQAWEFASDSEANTWRDHERRAGYELPPVG